MIAYKFCVPEKTADKLIPVFLQDLLKPDLNKLYLQTDPVLHCDSRTCVAESQDKFSHHMHYHVCLSIVTLSQIYNYKK